MEKLVALANLIAEFITTLIAKCREFASGWEKKIDFPNMK